MALQKRVVAEERPRHGQQLYSPLASCQAAHSTKPHPMRLVNRKGRSAKTGSHDEMGPWDDLSRDSSPRKKAYVLHRTFSAATQFAKHLELWNLLLALRTESLGRVKFMTRWNDMTSWGSSEFKMVGGLVQKPAPAPQGLAWCGSHFWQHFYVQGLYAAVLAPRS